MTEPSFDPRTLTSAQQVRIAARKADGDSMDWGERLAAERRWESLSPEKMKRAVFEHVKCEADRATAEYHPTCADLLDLPASIYLPFGIYVAAGTYICEQPLEHCGDHTGYTLDAYAWLKSEDPPEYLFRIEEFFWSDNDHRRRRFSPPTATPVEKPTVGEGD